MKIVSALFILLISMNFSLAQEKKESSLAAEFLELMNVERAMTATSKVAFAPFLKQLEAQGVPSGGIQEVKAAADAYFAQIAGDPDLKKEMAKIYEKAYTAAEMKELVVFYNSPLGQKMLKSMPELMQQGAKLGEKYAQKHSPSFQAKMGAIMEKYKGK